MKWLTNICTKEKIRRRVRKYEGKMSRRDTMNARRCLPCASHGPGPTCTLPPSPTPSHAAPRTAAGFSVLPPSTEETLKARPALSQRLTASLCGAQPAHPGQRPPDLPSRTLRRHLLVLCPESSLGGHTAACHAGPMTDAGSSEQPLPAMQGQDAGIFQHGPLSSVLFVFLLVCSPSIPQLKCKLFEGKVTDPVIAVSSALGQWGPQAMGLCMWSEVLTAWLLAWASRSALRY